MITQDQMKESLDILSKARSWMSHQDFVNIWGEQLGNHIWRQEGKDLLRIWKSGLTKEQADSFIDYILNKERVNKPNLNKPAFKVFPDAAESISKNICPICNKEIKKEDFKDALSIKEFSISGMCQECQDKTFG